MMIARIGLLCIVGAAILATSKSNGDDKMIQETKNRILTRIVVGMPRKSAESELEDLNIHYQFFSRVALTRLYGAAWERETPNLLGRFVGRLQGVSSHSIGETDLSVEVDIRNDGTVKAVRVTPVHVAP